MHLFKEHAVGDYEAAARAIPVIDYGSYFAGEPGALEKVAADVARACENVGFFYALNHGVPDAVTDYPARYPPAVYRDLVLEFYRANYFHQKGHRSAVAAQAAE
jgi:hypothetical protein